MAEELGTDVVLNSNRSGGLKVVVVVAIRTSHVSCGMSGVAVADGPGDAAAVVAAASGITSALPLDVDDGAREDPTMGGLTGDGVAVGARTGMGR